MIQKNQLTWLHNTNLRRLMKSAVDLQVSALSNFGNTLPESLFHSIQIIYECTGPLIIVGIGKSGHIGRKLASTFCSLGKASVFLHAAEASHGDLGLIRPDSVVLILSNSGETAELSDVLVYCHQLGNCLIGITATTSSTLSKACRITIAYGEVEEACINKLAPTTSTTLSLLIGDLLAIGVSHLNGNQPEDFRKYHPGGKLGARLKKVKQIMIPMQNLPIVDLSAAMSDVVIEMSEKGLGVALVLDSSGTYKIITDGDLRRHAKNLWQTRAADLITQKCPLKINGDKPATEALAMMNENRITSLVVHDNHNRTCGLITIHECLRAGIR